MTGTTRAGTFTPWEPAGLKGRGRPVDDPSSALEGYPARQRASDEAQHPLDRSGHAGAKVGRAGY